MRLRSNPVCNSRTSTPCAPFRYSRRAAGPGKGLHQRLALRQTISGEPRSLDETSTNQATVFVLAHFHPSILNDQSYAYWSQLTIVDTVLVRYLCSDQIGLRAERAPGRAWLPAVERFALSGAPFTGSKPRSGSAGVLRYPPFYSDGFVWVHTKGSVPEVIERGGMCPTAQVSRLSLSKTAFNVAHSNLTV